MGLVFGEACATSLYLINSWTPGLRPHILYLFICARLNMDVLFRVHFNIHDHFLEIFVFSIKPIYNFSQLRCEFQAYWAFISTTVNRPITKMVDVISLASSLKKCNF